MTVAVLKPYSLLHRVVKILCPDYAEDRHHQLGGDERMFLRSFKDDAADVGRNGNSDHGKKSLCVSSDTFTVESAARKDNIDQFFLLFLACEVAVVIVDEIMHQLINDR